jgi:hypothetical protein
VADCRRKEAHVGALALLRRQEFDADAYAASLMRAKLEL